jgi:hypothetical protein
MGLKRLDHNNWLTLDSNYVPEHILRSTILSTSKAQVLQCLPESEHACHEVLSLVSNFLVARYPQHFSLLPNPASAIGATCIRNHLTNETFPIGPHCSNPLETVARLAMEDFNILMKDPESGEWRLKASATVFPAGWKLQERIGGPMAVLHAPVPAWEERLAGSVDRYFNHLCPKSSMERHNLFIQTTPDLFQDCPEVLASPSGSLAPEDIRVRRERQTFTRLEGSGAVLFTVRTWMERLVEMEEGELEGLLWQVEGWGEEMGRYKRRGVWGSVVEGWCEEKLGGKNGKIKDGKVGEDGKVGDDVK